MTDVILSADAFLLLLRRFLKAVFLFILRSLVTYLHLSLK